MNAMPTVPNLATCPHCNGDGVIDSDHWNPQLVTSTRCHLCAGSGFVATEHETPPTFAERHRAIDTYRSLSWSDDWQGAPVNADEQAELAKPYTGPFVTAYLNALSHAEREALRAAGEPVELTTWELIKAEARENEAAFLGGALVWLVLLGVGLVGLAVKWGWIQ